MGHFMSAQSSRISRPVAVITNLKNIGNAWRMHVDFLIKEFIYFQILAEIKLKTAVVVLGLQGMFRRYYSGLCVFYAEI